MNEYLCFRAGPHRLLLDIRHVVEVGDAPAGDTGAMARRRWRDGSLPVVNLPAFLGAQAPQRAQQVVLGDSGTGDGIIDVDAVEGFRVLPPEHFMQVAQMSEALAALVDAVALDGAGGDCLLRLRHPFAWQFVTAEDVA